MEPREGEPFDVRKSTRLDSTVAIVEDVAQLRRQAQVERSVRLAMLRDRSGRR